MECHSILEGFLAILIVRHCHYILIFTLIDYPNARLESKTFCVLRTYLCYIIEVFFW